MRIAFDLSHREIFSPMAEGPLNYSDFYKSLKKSYTVTVNTGRVTGEALSGLDVYIIAGPVEEFSPHEIQAIEEFVFRGGNLLVLLHISQSAARLTEAFGIIVSNFVITEDGDTIGGSPRDFFVTRFTPHPVTEGLLRVAVLGTFGLMAEKGSLLLAVTSDEAWADMNRNLVRDAGEPVQAFGIIAAREYGGGRVVVVSDDAPFANAFINTGDNKNLADNIIRWFGEKDILEERP